MGDLSFDHKAAQSMLREELEMARQLIIDHIRANGQNASGRTIASLHVETDEGGGVLYGHRPFGVLETGRKAGKTPRSFRTIIYQWMMDKGIHATPIPYLTNRPHKYTEQMRADLSMASAIAHTIKTQGSSLYRKGGRNDVYSNVIPQTIERIRSRMISLVHQDIKTITINQ